MHIVYKKYEGRDRDRGAHKNKRERKDKEMVIFIIITRTTATMQKHKYKRPLFFNNAIFISGELSVSCIYVLIAVLHTKNRHPVSGNFTHVVHLRLWLLPHRKKE